MLIFLSCEWIEWVVQFTPVTLSVIVSVGAPLRQTWAHRPGPTVLGSQWIINSAAEASQHLSLCQTSPSVNTLKHLSLNLNIV